MVIIYFIAWLFLECHLIAYHIVYGMTYCALLSMVLSGQSYDISPGIGDSGHSSRVLYNLSVLIKEFTTQKHKKEKNIRE